MRGVGRVRVHRQVAVVLGINQVALINFFNVKVEGIPFVWIKFLGIFILRLVPAALRFTKAFLDDLLRNA